MHNLFSRILSFIVLFFVCFWVQAQKKPTLKIGFGVSNLYDLYEGPKDLTSSTGNVNYKVTDIDLKGLNGSHAKFDVGVGVIAELRVNKSRSVMFSYTHGTMTAQQENQYSISKVNLINAGLRQYFKADNNKKGFSVRPYGELGFGVTQFKAERYFIEDKGLFSQTSGATLSSTLAVGCQFNLSPKVQITAAPNFIINYADDIDGYNNKGADIMLSSTIGLLFNL